MKQVNYSFNNCNCFCDNCNREELIDQTDYKRINNELKNYGWIIVNIDGIWSEFCSKECLHEFKLKNC